jgi:hypothetical protein
MLFGFLTVLRCRRAAGGELVELPTAPHSTKKPLPLFSGDDTSFSQLLTRVRDACGAAPHEPVTLEFTDPCGGAEQLELSDDAQLCTALMMLEDAPQARVASLVGATLACVVVSLRARTRIVGKPASAPGARSGREHAAARSADGGAAAAYRASSRRQQRRVCAQRQRLLRGV